MDADDLSDWLRSQLPPGSAAALRAVGVADARLFPAEAGLIPRAGDKRRREFAAGRAGAREALVAIGFPPAPRLAHPEGDPAWPAGAVGSIAHTDTWAVAVVSTADRLRGLGVDLESDAPLAPDLAAAICRPEERDPSPDLAARGLDAAKLRFVAKEAYIKAAFPIRRQPLAFEDVSIGFVPGTDRFRARVANDGPEVDGVFRHAGGLICALCALPP